MTAALITQRQIAELRASGLNERTQTAVTRAMVSVLAAYVGGVEGIHGFAAQHERGAGVRFLSRFLAEVGSSMPSLDEVQS